MKLMHALFKILMFPFALVGKILAVLIGKINWSMPPWLAYLSVQRKQSPAKFVVTICVILFACFGAYKSYDYYLHLPQPILVEAIIIAPDTPAVFDEATRADDKAQAPLRIQFAYKLANRPSLTSPQHPSEQLPEAPPELLRNAQVASASSYTDFPSVAPIDMLGSEVKSGIKLSPSKAGVWLWEDDRTLVFTPETPWPAGQEYEVSFAPEVFDTQDEFTDDQFSFVTTAMRAIIDTSEFELSVEEKLKQVYVDISFNYPVNKQSVETALALAYQLEGNKLDKAESIALTFSDDLYNATAILQVSKLPDQPRIVEVKLNSGVKSIYGGEPTESELASKVMVPDLYSYLKVEQSNIEVLRNLDNEPEQFVLLGFTDAVAKDELLQKLGLYMLPKANEKNGKNYWQSPREVTAALLSGAKQVDFVFMPNAKDDAKNYQIKLNVTPGRQLYLKIDSGLVSANGFIQRAYFDRILSAPKYPQEVIIAGEGSVLTHSKDQRLAFSARGISDVKISIGKVIDDELYHLVSQTQGDISNPNFYNWSFNETNLAEFSSQFIRMNDTSSDLRKANYASVDLNGLMAESKEGLGLFFVEIKAWDKKRNREIYGVSDKLLVLVTDLGVIVKSSQDESQDIFVQSIKTGKPVAGANVELIAKNGTKLFSKTTNRFGHVTLPAATGYQREKEPVVYVVRRQGDVSFIPFNRYTRQVNYSRFNVGGEYSYYDNEERVNAFMFTDRGIYRPGETVNIGMVVKGKSLQNLRGIPLELVIYDAQYTEVHTEKITLPKFGFVDAKFITDKSVKTGSYSASLHLVRDTSRGKNVRDRQVGSLNFDVEEFQPDTMAITSQIKDLPNKGWTTLQKLTSNITLTNLFGVPAQDRRVKAELTLSPHEFYFEEFDGVKFNHRNIQGDSTDGLKSVDKKIEEQLTDADGQASIPIDLSGFDKGSYKVKLQSKGFEASGGRSVSTSNTFLYSPLPYLVGFKADGKLDFINLDAERAVSLIAISNELVPVALGNLRKRISLVQNISTLVKQYNGRYQYESIEKREVINESAYSLGAEFTDLSLDTSSAGTFVLDIVNADGEVLLSLQYTVAGATNDSGKLDKNAELKVTLNKSDYQEGEDIELSIQAPYAGSGLISIESNQLHSFKWFSSATNSSVQRIKIPNNIEGNAYVNVTFVRDVSSKEIFTSPLSYAVMPFSIDRSKRVLDVEVSVDDIVQPGKPMDISLTLSQDARVAVYAVDLGILQVANYRTPNPLAHFLKKRALNVRTMQILDLILPDFALTKMLSAAGGDMEADEFAAARSMVTGSLRQRSSNPFERKVQEPAVFWSGVVDAAKGSNTYTFNVPNDFAGGLRVMAIAVGEETIGRAQQNTIVRGPFVLTPNVLNQTAPGDEFEITLSVANVIKDIADNADVTIELSTSEHVSIIGKARSQMQLSENQEDAVRFKLKANNKLGGATITFDVSLTDESGKTWQSTRTASLSIRPAMPYEVIVSTGVSEIGEISINTPLQFYPAQSTQAIRASISPLVITEGLSAYLDEYPHGCTEQIVSQVFPLIGLSNLPKYSPNNDKVAAHFNEVISKLAQRQNYAGGFSYWQNANNSGSDYDVSLYVMHFLIEAKDLGYSVPQDMLQAGVRYLDDTATAYIRNAGRNSDSISSLLTLRKRAKGIYLLTRSGVVTSNLLIDLLSTLDKQHKAAWRGDVLSAYIAASHALMQQDEQAQELIVDYDLADSSLLVEQAFAGLAPRLSLDAQYLYLVAKHFPEVLGDVSGLAVLNITQAIYKGQYNTVSAAYSMLALGAYHSAVGALNPAVGTLNPAVGVLNPAVGVLNPAVGIDNIEAIDREISFIAATLQQQSELKPVYTPFATALYPSGTERIEASLSKSALFDTGGLYYVNVQAGYQSELPKDPSEDHIVVQRTFVDETGEPATKVKQGDELTVRLRVRSVSIDNIENIAIVDLLPGGFEVIRKSIDRKVGRWQSDYIDIREDRIVFYGSISKRVSEISYKVKVTAAGTFVVPPSFAEAMYDRGINGYSAASSIHVMANEQP
ncbi:MAG: hypothetical protein ACI97K_001386 [Glaciecola sp.]|jgi:uncharacterized protein YfaS (alpha-2-macroglobulin family)